MGKQDNCQVAVTLSACEPSCELAGSLSALSTKGVGDGPCTSAQSRSPQGNYLQN
ncbi:hypothetical protein IVB55_05015 [Bradyrhizobium sp. CW4]|nr:hypothetical protein [Bradyrhizobium sp. CW4]